MARSGNGGSRAKMQRLFFFLFEWLVLGFGCSGKSTPGAGSSNVVSADDLVNRFVKATCDAIGACCASASLPFARDQCESSMTREAQHLLTDTNASRVYDGAGAARCIDRATMLLSLCATSTLIADQMKHSCEEVYAGTVAVGGACQSTKDCAQGSQGPAQCDVDATTMGTPLPMCVVDPPGQLGEPCLGPAPIDPNVHFPHLTCADGLYCGTSGTCQSRVAVGGACIHDDECIATWCDTTSPTSGMCAARLPNGSACTFHR